VPSSIRSRQTSSFTRIEVRPMLSTTPSISTRSPWTIGIRNVISSIAAVTTVPRACRIAA